MPSKAAVDLSHSTNDSAIGEVVVNKTLDEQPRTPTASELGELANWLVDEGHDRETAEMFAKNAFVGVFPRYMTGGPGFVGKVMFVVWEGSPSMFDVFTWHEGELHQEEKE